MIKQFDFGDVSVTRVTEYLGPTHDPRATFPDLDERLFAQIIPKLPENAFIASMNKVVITINIWVVRYADKIILIDTGVGNGKLRLRPHMTNLNTLALQWLEAAGAPREQVTHVLMTHLHGDHVGWNTVKTENGWEPTFPNAEHFVPSRDLAFFRELHGRGEGDGSFGDSILPIEQAGLIRHYNPGDELAGFLEVHDAKGHTPGMTNLWFKARDTTGVFCADVFHHPLQIYEPSWNTVFCVLQDEARATRRDFIERALRQQAVIMPCHFNGAGLGRITNTDGIAFQAF